MEHQGKGILQAGRDYDIVRAYDEAFGLRELRAKVNGKAGITGKHAPNRFSINAEFNYGTYSVKIVRDYLDSGVLLQCLEDDFWKNDRCWSEDDVYRFHILAACAMSLGCTLPAKMKESIESMQHPAYVELLKKQGPTGLLKPHARVQLKKALAEYKDGEPYNYGNKTLLEVSATGMFPGKTTIQEFGSSKIITVTQANGSVMPQVVGPPSDEEMGLEAIYPNEVCATCGAQEAEAGRELKVCARCKDRKYCGNACQKKHWKMHKIICMRPVEEMKTFMASIPPDFKSNTVKSVYDDADAMAFMGNSDTMVISG